MSESNLWNRLRTNMVGKYWAEATRHEDKLQRGIADVSFCQNGAGGWMELKHVSDWPARRTTTVKIPHYSIDQKEFLTKKGKAMGNTWLFIQIGSDFVLYDHIGAQHVGELTKEQMVGNVYCYAYWRGKLDYSQFARALVIGAQSR